MNTALRNQELGQCSWVPGPALEGPSRNDGGVFPRLLVAAMTVHGINRLLTFNAGDFARYGIEVIEPTAIS